MKKLILLNLFLFVSVSIFAQITVDIKKTLVSPPRMQGDIEYDAEIINESQVNYVSVTGYIEVSNYEGKKLGRTEEINIKKFDILDKEKKTFNVSSEELWNILFDEFIEQNEFEDVSEMEYDATLYKFIWITTKEDIAPKITLTEDEKFLLDNSVKLSLLDLQYEYDFDAFYIDLEVNNKTKSPIKDVRGWVIILNKNTHKIIVKKGISIDEKINPANGKIVYSFIVESNENYSPTDKINISDYIISFDTHHIEWNDGKAKKIIKK